MECCCCCCWVTELCPAVCDPMDCSMPGFPVFYYLLEFAQIHVHWVSDAIQPSNPLQPPSPPVLNLSQHQGLFQRVYSLYQVAKVLELQLQHQSSNEYSGLISFRIDWFDFLAVQGTKSLQNDNSKVLILWCSAFFMVQLLHNTWLLEKLQLWIYGPLSAKWCLCFLIAY